MLVSIAITTQGFSDNRGLSFYGEHLNTVIPFALGFCLCDFFLLKVAKLLPEVADNLSVLTMPLKILSILLISIVLTPDNLNGLFSILHTVASTALFLFELILSVWLTLKWYRSVFSWLLLCAQFLAGIVAGLSEFQISHYLSESSLFYQLFFSTLLIWSITVISRQAVETPSSSRSIESFDT
ncbi:MAG: hypothetical protein ACYCPS_02010 [Candidatus Saccharimonadales bacterium]